MRPAPIRLKTPTPINLTPEQITAMVKAREIGEALAHFHPEMVYLYKKGTTQQKITETYLPEEATISEKVAVNAVGYALKRLLPEEERTFLSKDHQRAGSTAVGNSTLHAGTGIHAQTLEERVEAAKKGYQESLGKMSSTVLSYFGRRGGKNAALTNARQGTGLYGLTREQHIELGRRNGLKNYEKGIGIHALTREERMEAAKRGILSQGKVLFNDKEKITLVELANNPAYHHPTGARQPGKPDYTKIREEMRDRFGVERTVSSLRTMYWRINRIAEQTG